jgi:NAD(P)H-dependent FMN reductase
VRSSPHILVIVGSTRKVRNADPVLNWLTNRLQGRSDATFEVADLRDLALPSFGVSAEGAPEAQAWAESVGNADGFIFVTPEYNHGYPAPLKNAIDHLYKEWGRKPAAIVSYGGFGGGYRAAEQLRQVLVELKAVPIREQVGIPAVWAAFGQAGEPQNDRLDASLDGMVAELLWWANALTPAREQDRAA